MLVSFSEVSPFFFSFTDHISKKTEVSVIVTIFILENICWF